MDNHIKFHCSPPSPPLERHVAVVLDFAEIVGGCYSASPDSIRSTAASVLLVPVRMNAPVPVLRSPTA